MRLFEQRERRRLLMADGFTIFGGWIDFITILNIAVFKFHANAFDIAVLSAAMLLPGIILAAPIGRIVNRSDALIWLRWSLLLRALLTTLLAFIPHYGLWLALLVLRATCNSLALPTITTISARNIGADQRIHYYSLLNMLNASAKIAAPALGAVLALLASDVFITLFSAALTLLGCLCFLSLRESRPSTTTALTSSTTEAKLGFGNRLWLGFAALNLVYFCALYMINNQLPVVIGHYGLGKSALGLLVATSASGNFLMSYISARHAGRANPPGHFRPLIMAIAGTLLLFMAMALVLHLAEANLLIMLMPLFFVQSLFSSLFAIAASVFLASNFSSTLGPASGQLQALQNGAMLVAPFAGAALLGLFAPSMLFLASGAFGLLAMTLLSLRLQLHLRQPTRIRGPDEDA